MSAAQPVEDRLEWVLDDPRELTPYDPDAEDTTTAWITAAVAVEDAL